MGSFGRSLEWRRSYRTDQRIEARYCADGHLDARYGGPRSDQVDPKDLSANENIATDLARLAGVGRDGSPCRRPRVRIEVRFGGGVADSAEGGSLQWRLRKFELGRKSREKNHWRNRLAGLVMFFA